MFYQNSPFLFIPKHIMVITLFSRVNFYKTGINTFFLKLRQLPFAVVVISHVGDNGGAKPQTMSGDGGIRTVSNRGNFSYGFVFDFISEVEADLAFPPASIADDMRGFFFKFNESVSRDVADCDEVKFFSHAV